VRVNLIPRFAHRQPESGFENQPRRIRSVAQNFKRKQVSKRKPVTM
jgi:hypothetical protein